MEFGLSTYLFVNERLTSHQLDQIAAAGLRTIEIFAARQHFDYQDKNQVHDVAQWFKDHDLRLHSLHAPLYADFDWGRSGSSPLSITYLERGRRIGSMEEIKRAVEVAEILPFRYLVSTHVHDNRRERDNHLFPFEGDIDWDATVRGFRSLDDRFPVLFELHDLGKGVSGFARLKQVMERFEAIR
jgi:sugar phosphate isomerase/epimerase